MGFSIFTRRRQWQPTPVLLPGKSHGWSSLVGCSPWGREEWDTTEQLHFHFSLLCIGEGNGNPLQCSCLESPRDGGAWWAAIYGVAQSRTWLKRLSRSSSSVLSQAEIWECSCRLSYRNDYQSKLTGWIQVGKQSWVGERSEGWDQKELISVQCQVQTGATRRTRF